MVWTKSVTNSHKNKKGKRNTGKSLVSELSEDVAYGDGQELVDMDKFYIHKICPPYCSVIAIDPR